MTVKIKINTKMYSVSRGLHFDVLRAPSESGICG